MNQFTFSAVVSGLLLVLAPGVRGGSVTAGVTLDEQGIRSFHLTVAQHYRVDESQVAALRARHIRDEELPVVCYLAQQARVAPGVIIDLHRGGKSWMEIALHYGLHADIFYVPVTAVVKGPPYGRAYGYYKNKPRKDWSKIALRDVEVVDLVNLRFAVDYHRCRPEDVIEARSAGQSFVMIHASFRESQKGRGGGPKKETGRSPRPKPDKGKAKGKDR